MSQARAPRCGYHVRVKNAISSRVLFAWIMLLPGMAAWSQVGLITASQQEQLQNISAAAKAAALRAHKPVDVSAKKRPFQDVVDEVYAGREEHGADLSAAAPGHRYYFDLHTQYRDGANEEFKDYRDRPAARIKILPELVAVDPFWAGAVTAGDAVYVRMENLYFFDFKVVGTTLKCHRILSELVWPKGQTPPWGTQTAVIEHGVQTLEPQQKAVITRAIGTREFRITFGYTVE